MSSLTQVPFRHLPETNGAVLHLSRCEIRRNIGHGVVQAQPEPVAHIIAAFELAQVPQPSRHNLGLGDISLRRRLPTERLHGSLQSKLMQDRQQVAAQVDGRQFHDLALAADRVIDLAVDPGRPAKSSINANFVSRSSQTA